MCKNSYQVILPMRVSTSNKKVKALNFNIYRNLHFFEINFQKIAFASIVKPLLTNIPILGKIKLRYLIFPKSLRRLDTMNVGCVVDKYFSDILTESGIILDDDYKNIVDVSFAFGGISKQEHVLVTITEIEKRIKKEKNMKMIFDNEDIKLILNNYLHTIGINQKSSIELLHDESGNITAEITQIIEEEEEESMSSASTTKVTKSKRGRPPGKTKKKETADVENTSESSSNRDAGASNTSGEKETKQINPKVDTDPEDQEDKKQKNLFEDTPEESSKETEPENNDSGSSKETTEIVTKKASIFGDS